MRRNAGIRERSATKRAILHAHMQRFYIHPENPQPRLIRQAAQMLRDGALIAYPTDSAYAIGCHIGDAQAAQKLRQLRGLDDKHHLTLVCADLSQISHYARVDNAAFRLLKRATPGPYTFILKATRELPKRLHSAKRAEVGLRVPAHPIVHALLHELGEPILSATFIAPGEDAPMHDPEDIAIGHYPGLDLLIDGNACPNDATTVIRLDEDGSAELVRLGAGDVAALGLSLDS
jgi:tRNA threonylcarbamoyl adenosine modification protein (Sua5/YciO/YrdC/YwlC family)